MSARDRDADDRPRSARLSFRLRVLAFALGATLLIALLVAVDANESVREWLRGTPERVRGLSPAMFVGLHALAVLALLPGAFFPLAAGVLYGVFPGVLYSVAGKTLGSAVAFLVARHLVANHRRSAWLERLRRRHPRFAVLERGLPRQGWRAIALIRLVPIVPFKLSSYFFGWTRFRFRDFVLGTLLGSIPYSLTNAYLGSLAGDLTTVSNRPTPQSATGWSLYLAAAALAIAGSVLITLRARRILRESDPVTPTPPRPDPSS